MATIAFARHGWTFVLCLFSALLLANCGGKGDGLPDQLELSLGEAPATMPSLPRPSDIPHAASAPPANCDLYRDGAAFDNAIIPRNATVQESTLLLDPDWHPNEVVTPDRLAFAAFRFANLDKYSGAEQIKLHWYTPPVYYQHAYLAVADFNIGAWRWYRIPSTDVVELEAFGDCINSGGDLVALVLFTGRSAARLDWLIIGDRLAPEARLSSSLNPDPGLNVAPLTVNFNGQGSCVIGGEIVAWDFDFEDDGSWDVAGDEDGLIQYVYATPGATTCRLRVHDECGAVGEQAMDFWVVDPDNQAPQAHFSMTPDLGKAPLAVHFDASNSSDDTGVRLYEWDFDGDGLFETSTGAEEIYNGIFAVKARSEITLRITDDDYATDTYTKTLWVTNGFTYSTVALGASINTKTSAALSGGRPCVTWQEYNNRDLKFSVAKNCQGSSYTLPVYPATYDYDTGYSPSMVSDELGFPLITYGKKAMGTDYSLEFVCAADFDGTSWNGPYIVSNSENVGAENALALVNGIPSIISVVNPATQGQTSLAFYQATSAAGSDWSSGSKLFDGPPTGWIENVSLLSQIHDSIHLPMVGFVWRENTNPLAVKRGFVRAQNQAGTTWCPLQLFDNCIAGSISLNSVAGFPALAEGSAAQGEGLYFSRAADDLGDSWPAGMSILLNKDYGGYCDLKLVNGKPAICFYSIANSDLWYVDAKDAAGTYWNDPYIVASAGDVGKYCSMAVPNGTIPVIFFYDDTNNSLMAAYWVP